MIFGFLLIKLFLLLTYVTATATNLLNNENIAVADKKYERSCEMTFDLMLVIDLTYSNGIELQQLKVDLAKLVDTFLSPGKTNRLSLAFFRDKPVPPFGHPLSKFEETCFELITGFEATAEEHKKRITELKAGGGFDSPEAQLDALFRAALSPEWSVKVTNEGTAKRFKVLAMITDSRPHFPDDYLRPFGRIRPPEFQFFTDPVLQAFDPVMMRDKIKEDPNFGCETYNYPRGVDAGLVLKEHNITPMFLLHYDVNCDNLNSTSCVMERNIPDPDYSYFKTTYKAQLKVDYENLASDMGVYPVIHTFRNTFNLFLENLVTSLLNQKLVASECIPLISKNLRELDEIYELGDVFTMLNSVVFFKRRPNYQMVEESEDVTKPVDAPPPGEEEKDRSSTAIRQLASFDVNAKDIIPTSEASVSSKLSKDLVTRALESATSDVLPRVKQSTKTATEENIFGDDAENQASVANTSASNESLDRVDTVKDKEQEVD